MAGPTRAWAVANDPDHEWMLDRAPSAHPGAPAMPPPPPACSTTTSAAPGPRPPRPTRLTSPTRPPARCWPACRCRGAADLDAAVRAARAALPDWRAVSVIDRAPPPVRPARGPRGARARSSRARSPPRWARRSSTRAPRSARMIEMVECACAIPTTMQGRMLEDVARNVDAETVRQPVGVCAAIVPVQLPGDGAVLVPALRHRLRQHVRAQALRAGPADPADRLRGARRARAAARRRQPRQRRPRGRRGDPRPPGHRRGLVRRLGARWRGSSTSARPRRASACRRWAGPRTTWSSCPTP